MDRKEKARLMYRMGEKTNVIKKTYNCFTHLTEEDRMERSKYTKLWKKKTCTNHGSSINMDVIQLTHLKNMEVTKQFDKVMLGATATLINVFSKRVQTKKGTCIYKDEKLFVLQYENHREAFSVSDLIGKWKILRIGGKDIENNNPRTLAGNE